MSIRKMIAPAALLVAVAGTPAAAEPEERLGPMAETMRGRVGSWCVAARLRFTPEARPLDLDARAESRLLGGRWLVTELRGMEAPDGFHGLGVNGWDPVRRRYTGYWVDGTRGFAIPVEGEYDSATGAFTTLSTERRADGGTVTVVSVTRPDGDGGEITTFTATGPDGRAFERMVLRYRRAEESQACASLQ